MASATSLSLPVIVGKYGAEQLLPIHLTEAEQAQLQNNATEAGADAAADLRLGISKKLQTAD
ncbi:MAG: hypothetical protein Q4E13_06780 [Clostridia bacterium]|nr:hypothetical protein [Clostridia bacterium]MDO4356193.1 hypothetical protein [Clostridia bacterium]